MDDAFHPMIFFKRSEKEFIEDIKKFAREYGGRGYMWAWPASWGNRSNCHVFQEEFMAEHKVMRWHVPVDESLIKK